MLSAVVLAAVAGQALNEQWSGDVWIHAAAVRELARHATGALDPVLGVDAPHPMLTPYTWVLGRASAWTGAGALTTLKVAALPNVVLLLVGLRSFTLAALGPGRPVPSVRGRRAAGHRATAGDRPDERADEPDGGEPVDAPAGDERAAFWVLLFTVCLWGPGAWRWSGLLHLGALGFTAPYPSMFATGLTLLIVGSALRRARSGPGGWLVAVAAAVAAVVLVHPPTAGALVIGLAATAVSRRHSLGGRGVALLVLAVAAGVGVAALWPYYPLFGLARTPSFDAMHQLIYESTWLRIGPALLGVLALARAWWRRHDDPLPIMAVACFAAVGAGAVTGSLWLGRLLPFGVLALHTALGGWAGSLERSFRRRRAAVAGLVAAVVLLGGWGALNARAAVVRTLPRAWVPSGLADDDRLDAASATYGPLLDGVADDDVVVAPLAESRYVPAFAGRAHGSYWENALVADDVARRQLVDAVYASPGTAERLLTSVSASWVVTRPEDQALDEVLRAAGWHRMRQVEDLTLWRRP